MIYLVVGLDRATFRPWHENIHAAEATAAAHIALDRAGVRGISPAVAAVIGPHSTVLPVRLPVRPDTSRAA